jgi:F-type H+-transporting ATPase subunit b
MFSDPQFWVALAFAIFVIALFNPVRKILSTSLDSKIKEIKDSIDEAENLKNETQITLSDIKKRQNKVELEIKKIHSNAKDKIKIIESEATEKLNEKTNKREQLAKTKIEQMARDANLSIQNNISQTAIAATIAVLEKKLNQDDKKNLINQSIKDFATVQKN